MPEKGKKLHLTLDEVGNFLAKFSEHSEQVYWISSPDFKKIQYISPSYERIWGRSREELYANPELWITFLHPDDVITHHPIHHMAEQIKLLGEKARYTEHYRIIRPDGEIRWIIDNGFPLIDEQGVCYAVTGVATDVTEENRSAEAIRVAKEAAEAANKAKDEFIANMSHDIRTPLSGIMGMSKLLEENAHSPQEKQYARWINESGQQLLELLNGVLDIVSSGNLHEGNIYQSTVDVRELIKEITQLVLPTIKLKKLELKIDIDPSVPQWIVTDHLKLHRILLNLISNAIKFTDQGHVAINVAIRSQQKAEIILLLTVSDTGIGIPKKLQDTVFERFFRATPSYKGIHQGHGVGLHITQKYVELLNGQIKLISEPGLGSTFSVMLPATISYVNPNISNANSYHPTNLRPDSKPSFAISPQILLVEDNIVALKIAESIATQAGCQFISAMSGEEAMELVKTKPFDLIISDIGLPGISGNELTQHIREWEYSLNKQPIPIIGLTAHVLAFAEKECLASGMNKVIAKPINLAIMQDILTTFVVESTVTTVGKTTSPLGRDLPDTEDQLFVLDKYPLLDVKLGASNLGNLDILKELLTLMATEAIPIDEASIQRAFAAGDWDSVENLAHKMKSGAIYCGATKMQYACQYLERYRKAGHSQLLDKLYYQLIKILSETKQSINNWLQQP